MRLTDAERAQFVGVGRIVRRSESLRDPKIPARTRGEIKAICPLSGWLEIVWAKHHPRNAATPWTTPPRRVQPVLTKEEKARVLAARKAAAERSKRGME